MVPSVAGTQASPRCTNSGLGASSRAAAACCSWAVHHERCVYVAQTAIGAPAHRHANCSLLCLVTCLDKQCLIAAVSTATLPTAAR